MMIGRNRFNIYLLFVLAVAVLSGCQTGGSKKKRVATFRIHIEVSADKSVFNSRVQVFRAQPVELVIDPTPFITEAEVQSLKVVDTPGGFAMQAQMNERGTLLLEEYTVAYPEKHIAIFSQFGEKKKESRCLAAPKITHRISNGLLTFTPDATREEAEQIAQEVNNRVEQIEKEDAKW